MPVLGVRTEYHPGWYRPTCVPLAGTCPSFADQVETVSSKSGLAACAGIGYAASLVIPTRRRELEGLTVYTLSSRAATPGEK